MPDGYTFFVGAAHHAIAPALYPNLDYNLEKDFIPVALIARPPQVVVVNLKSRTFSRGAGAAGESPPTSAKQWTRYVDAESGYPYLLCEETGESRWETAPAA